MVELLEAVPGGCRLSDLVQGYWRLADWGRGAAETHDFIHRHLDLGISSVDHADIYGDYRCEALFGAALAREPGLRDRLQIVTKCNIMLTSQRYPERRTKHYDSSARHIRMSVENSLKRLGTDRIDLLLLHRPDPLLDADDVAGCFTRLKAEGKVLHFGVSNFAPESFVLLQSRLGMPLSTNQVEINPFSLGRLPEGTLEQLQRLRTRPMAWSCLAGGRVFDRADPAGARLREVLDEVGSELGGAGPDQVLHAWVLKLPSRPLPILGSGRIERVEAAVAARQLSLSREQWFRILEAGSGRAVP